MRRIKDCVTGFCFTRDKPYKFSYKCREGPKIDNFALRNIWMSLKSFLSINSMSIGAFHTNQQLVFPENLSKLLENIKNTFPKISITFAILQKMKKRKLEIGFLLKEEKNFVCHQQANFFLSPNSCIEWSEMFVCPIFFRWKYQKEKFIFLPFCFVNNFNLKHKFLFDWI